MEVKNFGSLYLNGRPSVLNAEYGGGNISLGDTVPEEAIPFVKWKDLWVAGKAICLNASWDDLNKHNFITGHPIKIDGVPYLCRSLKVGEKENVPNEWDSILDDLGEDDNLWHWGSRYFWGQEGSKYEASSRAVRGYSSARLWSYHGATSRYVFVGFRPVLEPLPPEPLVSDTLIGANLKVYGPDTAIIGQLVEYTDYDLVMVSNADLRLPQQCQWARRDGKHIIIDQTAVIWMKEE